MLIDEKGSTFGYLVVVRMSGRDNSGAALWLCRCVCGEVREVSGPALRAGRNKSCGCKSPRFKPKNPSQIISNKRAYTIWSGMISRCAPTAKGKSRRFYYEKGIRVCKAWRNFKGFYKDMGDPPDGASIDRIDGNKGYFKENCRWATPKQQANNTSRNHIVEYEGRKMTIAEWADEIGVKPNTLLYRIRRGASLEDSMKKKMDRKNCARNRAKKRESICPECGSVFHPRKSQTKEGRIPFCSHKCSYQSRATGEDGRFK